MAATTGSGSDVVLPIIVALIVLGAGAAYLLSRRNRPTDHGVIRGTCPRSRRRGRGRRLASAPRPRARARPRPARDVAAHTLNATYASRLPLAVYLVGAAMTVALSFVFVIVRDVRAAPPDLDGRRAPSRRPGSATRSARSGSSAGSGSSPRASPAARATATSRRCSCGSTAGSGWPSSARSSARLALPRPVLDPPRPRRRGSCDGSASRAGRSADYPARLGRWPAAIGFAFFVWLELVIFGRRRRRCSSCSSATPPSRSR